MILKKAHIIEKNAILILIVLVCVALANSSLATQSKGEKIVSSSGYQAIKAKVIDDIPTHFTIDVKSLSNLGADENAPFFAIYTSSFAPDFCADFSAISLKHYSHGKYERVFDLSSHKEVIQAIDKYDCVIVKNIPSDSAR